jgi:hypothetical protein
VLSSFVVALAALLLLTPDLQLLGSSTHALGVALLVLGGTAATVQALVMTSRETEARQLRRRSRV